MSYPDLIEEDGAFFLTETQKTIARVHPVDRTLLEGLWGQFDNQRVATDGLVLSLPQTGRMMPPSVRSDIGRSLAVEFWVELTALTPRQVLLDSRDENGRGIVVRTTARETVEIVLQDGRKQSRWDCDTGLLAAGRLQHIVVNVDAGPKIITFIVDGQLCDGGRARQFGWGRFDADLRYSGAGRLIRIGPSLQGRIHRLRLYDRYLRTSEAVGNHRGGLGDR